MLIMLDGMLDIVGTISGWISDNEFTNVLPNLSDFSV